MSIALVRYYEDTIEIYGTDLWHTDDIHVGTYLNPDCDVSLITVACYRDDIETLILHSFYAAAFASYEAIEEAFNE